MYIACCFGWDTVQYEELSCQQSLDIFHKVAQHRRIVCKYFSLKIQLVHYFNFFLIRSKKTILFSPCKPGSSGLDWGEGLSWTPCSCCQCLPAPRGVGYPGKCKSYQYANLRGDSFSNENQLMDTFYLIWRYYQGITERLDMWAKYKVTRPKKSLDPIAHLLTHLSSTGQIKTSCLGKPTFKKNLFCEKVS